MAAYSFNDKCGIEIDFNGVKPDYETRAKMKTVKYRWNPDRMIWWVYKNDNTIAMAKEICGENARVITKTLTSPPVVPVRTTIRKVPQDDYALKVKIKDIVNADKALLKEWEKKLKEYVNYVMS